MTDKKIKIIDNAIAENIVLTFPLAPNILTELLTKCFHIIRHTGLKHNITGYQHHRPGQWR